MVTNCSLVGRNEPVVDLQDSRSHQFYDAVTKDPSVSHNSGSFEDYTNVNRYPVSDPAALGLGEMPVVCGDALYDHTPDNETLRTTVEAALTESLLSVPLISTCPTVY